MAIHFCPGGRSIHSLLFVSNELLKVPDISDEDMMSLLQKTKTKLMQTVDVLTFTSSSFVNVLVSAEH